MVIQSEAFVEGLEIHMRQELRNYDVFKGLPLDIDHEEFSTG